MSSNVAYILHNILPTVLNRSEYYVVVIYLAILSAFVCVTKGLFVVATILRRYVGALERKQLIHLEDLSRFFFIVVFRVLCMTYRFIIKVAIVENGGWSMTRHFYLFSFPLVSRKWNDYLWEWNRNDIVFSVFFEIYWMKRRCHFFAEMKRNWGWFFLELEASFFSRDCIFLCGNMWSDNTGHWLVSCILCTENTVIFLLKFNGRWFFY